MKARLHDGEQPEPSGRLCRKEAVFVFFDVPRLHIREEGWAEGGRVEWE